MPGSEVSRTARATAHPAQPVSASVQGPATELAEPRLDSSPTPIAAEIVHCNDHQSRHDAASYSDVDTVGQAKPPLSIPPAPYCNHTSSPENDVSACKSRYTFDVTACKATSDCLRNHPASHRNRYAFTRKTNRFRLKTVLFHRYGAPTPSHSKRRFSVGVVAEVGTALLHPSSGW
jgi:hypothetical protein